MLEAGARGARLALVALLVGGAGGCHGGGRGSEEEYARTVDPGLREEYYWAVVGTGDCPAGGDTTSVAGEAEPAAERCDAARFGTIAVCPDGRRDPDPQTAAGPRCVYTERQRGDCPPRQGGKRLWECVRTDAE